MDEAYRRKGENDLDGARKAFLDALAHGANEQVVRLELGYLAQAQHDREGALAAFRAAAAGPNRELGQEAERELSRLTSDAPASAPTRADPDRANAQLELAYERKAQHDPQGAAAAFRAAEQAGADVQLVALELAYLALDQHDAEGAKHEFGRAAQGPDPARREQAMRELAALQNAPEQRPLWGDVYAEVFAWSRFVGANQDADLVPTLRVRGMYTWFFSSLDLSAYLVAQATRDLASHGAGTSGVPLIYADNTALLGGGALLRTWQRQLSFFAQLGPAFRLVDDGGPPVRFDLRIGTTLGLESPGCWPAARNDSEWRFAGCHELYAEVTYASRYDHDVIGFARGRSSLSFAITGPLEWQLTLEARLAADVNGEYYNNFAEAGMGPRVRLLAPVHVELMFAPQFGSYFGRSHTDPAPHPLYYSDLRVQAATYFEF